MNVTFEVFKAIIMEYDTDPIFYFVTKRKDVFTYTFKTRLIHGTEIKAKHIVEGMENAIMFQESFLKKPVVFPSEEAIK